MSRVPLSVGLWLIYCVGLWAQVPKEEDRRPPRELVGYSWEQDAKEWKMKAADVATLKQQGFVVTDETYRQVFTPYLGQTHLFITSDSMINAYSVLLEDSILRLERVNARRLETFLRVAWKVVEGIDKGPKGDVALLKAATARAQIVMGVALELATGEKSAASPELAAVIDQEARRVVAATGSDKPAWLGPPDAGLAAIDYTRFQPRGFYAGKAKLERYFRATAWLQAIPFRFDRDEELTAYLLLYEKFKDRDNKELERAVSEIELVKESYDQLVGRADNEDPFGFSSVGWRSDEWNAETLKGIRKMFSEQVLIGPQIDDQISLGQDGKPERSFRLLSAHRLPDAVLFARTKDFRQADFPSGLEVAAALGSERVRKLYEGKRGKLLATIAAQKELFHGRSLYTEFLDALAVLLHPVDKAAPELFHTPAWEEKSLQTFLGGWAQARHAWVLQAKQNYSTIGAAMTIPSGFVEPVPEFFNKMGQLSLNTVQTFTAMGAYDAGAGEAVEDLRAMAAAQRRFAEQRKQDKKARPTEEERALLFQGESWISMAENDSRPLLNEPEELAVALEKLANRLEKEGTGSDDRLKQVMMYNNPTPESNGAALRCYVSSWKLWRGSNSTRCHLPRKMTIWP